MSNCCPRSTVPADIFQLTTGSVPFAAKFFGYVIKTTPATDHALTFHPKVSQTRTVCMFTQVVEKAGLVSP